MFNSEIKQHRVEYSETRHQTHPLIELRAWSLISHKFYILNALYPCSLFDTHARPADPTGNPLILYLYVITFNYINLHFSRSPVASWYFICAKY